MLWNSFDLDVRETGDARRMYARKVSLQLFVKLQMVRKQFVSFFGLSANHCLNVLHLLKTCLLVSHCQHTIGLWACWIEVVEQR